MTNLRLVWTNPDPRDHMHFEPIAMNDHLIVYRKRRRWHWSLESYTRGFLARSPFGYLSPESAIKAFAFAFDADVVDRHNETVKWWAGDSDNADDDYRRIVDIRIKA